MKKIVITLFVIFNTLFIANAQVPGYFKYLAVVRDAEGVVVGDKKVALKISILQGGETGSVAYAEVFNTLTTNKFGVIAVEVGHGQGVDGNFSTIDWAASTYYLKIAIDLDAGTNYQFMGTSQILSVPYALHAKKATEVIGGNDADPTNEIQDLHFAGNILTITNNTNATPINLNAFSGDNTDEQILSYGFSNGNLDLTIGGGTGGNEINIPLVSRTDGGTFENDIEVEGDITTTDDIIAAGDITASGDIAASNLNLGVNFSVTGPIGANVSFTAPDVATVELIIVMIVHIVFIINL